MHKQESVTIFLQDSFNSSAQLTDLPSPPTPPSFYPTQQPILRKRDKSGWILIVLRRWRRVWVCVCVHVCWGGLHVSGVLLVSMTTVSGAIKIWGANGSERVGSVSNCPSQCLFNSISSTLKNTLHFIRLLHPYTCLFFFTASFNLCSVVHSFY